MKYVLAMGSCPVPVGGKTLCASASGIKHRGRSAAHRAVLTMALTLWCCFAIGWRRQSQSPFLIRILVQAVERAPRLA